jgi:PIN domain
MVESAVTPNVFLDTAVFDAHQLDFDSPNIRRLARLAANGTIHLLLTTVTKREVLEHLEEQAAEAFRTIKEFRKRSRVMRKVLPGGTMDALDAAKREAMTESLKSKFEAFLTESSATVLPIDQVPAEPVLTKYFDKQPPFGQGKKSAFPDAFAFSAVQAWSVQNAKAKVYVVSSDGDWQAACAEQSAFLHVERLDQLLQLFADSVLVTALLEALDANHEKVSNEINVQLGEVGVYPGINLIDGEVDDANGKSVDIEDARIVEAQDGTASASVLCTLTIEAYVEADDPNSAVYDADRKSYVHVGRIGGWVEREFERSVEVTLNYDPKNPERASISGARFYDPEFDLNVAEDELSRDSTDHNIGGEAGHR